MSVSIPSNIEEILSLSVAWFQGREDTVGIALVGSYAHGTARSDSDVDLVILSTTPEAYREPGWLESLPWKEVGLSVTSFQDVDYGLLWSRHVLLSSGLEVEFGFAGPEWAATDPPDEGTLGVMCDGHCILYDPLGILSRLTACSAMRYREK